MHLAAHLNARIPHASPSSPQATIAARSLRITKTHHFGAMYSQQRSHRDRPMLVVPFLRAMMQTEEPGAEDVDSWMSVEQYEQFKSN